MKKLGPVFFALGLYFLPVYPALANSCPRLIREGRDLLSKASMPADQSDKIKGLLDEAQSLHQSGNHGESMTKANEALGMLKKP
jgi:hypothetical protein